MNKWWTVLGFTLLLAGCFDQPKSEAEVKNRTETKATETAENRVSSMKETTKEAETEMPKSEMKSTEGAEANVAKMPEKSGMSSERTEDEKSKQSDATVSDDAEKTVTAATAENALAATKKDNVVKKSVAKAKTKTKATNSTKAEEYDENGLSPEEQRVGAQQTNQLSESEIKALKYKCRYPLMTEQERVEYHCEVKKATIR